MSQHPNRGTRLDWPEALPRLVELRRTQRPADWQTVCFDLGYSKPADLSPLRWMVAAQLKALNPELTWGSVAADPAVDLKEDTLKKRHASARLACGLSFGEYVEQFRESYQAALRRELANDAEDYAQRFKRLLDGCLSRCERSAERLDNWQDSPPLMPGEETLRQQMALTFADSGLPLAAPMTAEAHRFLRTENRSLIDDVATLTKLMKGEEPIPLDSLDEEPLDAATTELVARAQYLGEQLSALAGMPSATPQGVA